MGPIIINILGTDCASIHFYLLFFLLYTHCVPGWYCTLFNEILLFITSKYGVYTPTHTSKKKRGMSTLEPWFITLFSFFI